MSSRSNKPSIQPRPTKASLLRTQKQEHQQESPSSVTPSMSGTASQVMRKELQQQKQQRSPSTSTTSTRYAAASPSAGVKAFMAQQRARLAKNKPKATTSSEEDNSKKKIVSNSNYLMTGAERYSDTSNRDKHRGEEITAVAGAQRKLSVVIKQAKSTGKLDISSRSLTKIPEEVIKMYHVDPNAIVVDFNATGDAWYDMEELTKIIASDNQIAAVDERIADEFGALKYMDFRDNQLTALPDRIEKLRDLTTVYLQHNSFKQFPCILFKLRSLRVLNLSHNAIEGNIYIKNVELEQLDLSHNRINHFEISDESCSRLIKLNISSNLIKQLPPTKTLKHCKNLQELLVNQNRLKTLTTVSNKEPFNLPSLIRLDASDNQIIPVIAYECEEGTKHNSENMLVSLPKLVDLSLGTNKLNELDKSLEMLLSGSPNLQNLDISSNQFQDLPDSIIDQLKSLQRLDVRGNQLRSLTYSLGKLPDLRVIHCEANPMRSYASMSQTQLINSLRSNYQLQLEEARKAQEIPQRLHEDEEGKHEIDSRKNELQKEPASDTVQHQEPKVDEPSLPLLSKPQTIRTAKLDLSRNELTEFTGDLIPSTNDDIPGIILLDHNILTVFPTNLNHLSAFVVELDLSHNRISQFNLTMEGLTFSNLKKLKLNNNRLKILEKDSEQVIFPQLTELDLSFNVLTSLPDDFAENVPNLKSLLISSNKLDNLTDKHFSGFKHLEILDLSNNDIGYLPPELCTITTLQQLVVFGNRFRVPRPAVVDQGTQAVLEFLRRRHLASVG